jgi:hypothetical protein
MDKKRLMILNLTTWIVVAASFLALFLMGPLVYDISCREFLRRIVISLYQPSVNICRAGMFDGLFLHQVVYGISVYSGMVVALWMRFKERVPFRDLGRLLLQRVAVSTFIMFTLLQTGGVIIHWMVKSAAYRFPDQRAKQRYWYGDSARFAEQIRGALPGEHNARLVTDLDFSRDPEDMFEHRKLAYFLYPIDIRGVRLGERDVIMVFHKKNPQQYVPASYEIVVRQGDDSLVAVRK